MRRIIDRQNVVLRQPDVIGAVSVSRVIDRQRLPDDQVTSKSRLRCDVTFKNPLRFDLGEVARDG